MASAAHPNDEAVPHLPAPPTATSSASRRQSAEAIGLLLAVLLVLLALVLTVGSPPGFGG